MMVLVFIPFAPRIDKRWDVNGMIVNASVCVP